MKAAKIQEIEVGKERAVVVPLDTWKRMLERLEELEDAKLYDEAVADADQTTIEHDELCRRVGRNPLRYLRGRAGMTQNELAARSGLSQSFIARTESGGKRLSASSRKRIARALGIKLEKLVF